MKVAFTVSGDGLDSPMDSRFGRALKFLIYDLDNDTFEILDNQANVDAGQGAGLKAAEMVARAGAGSLVTGWCGPKAVKALAAAKIAIYNTTLATAADALRAFREGKIALQDPAGE
ncbi:MAG: NifB/NifX family molybdenum-iron cluster-binding protein [Pseudomonadota bacterium]